MVAMVQNYFGGNNVRLLWWQRYKIIRVALMQNYLDAMMNNYYGGNNVKLSWWQRYKSSWWQRCKIILMAMMQNYYGGSNVKLSWWQRYKIITVAMMQKFLKWQQCKTINVCVRKEKRKEANLGEIGKGLLP